MIDRSRKETMHPRNRFRSGYDFRRLIGSHPTLAAFVSPNAHGDPSIDYANPAAVKTLNQALLKDAYGVSAWDIPKGYLCPPIPGRSDYIHSLADLLKTGGRTAIPRGPSVAVLDIGTGANCIYPLIGASEYGWRFVGSDIDPAAVQWARKLVAANPPVAGLITCRLQASALACFKNVVRPDEFFDASMCNPPFHASAAEARAGNARKRRNLGALKTANPLNFGGKEGELWCEGGEAGFVRRMIEESALFPRQFRWFTTLVSKSAHLASLQATLRRLHATEVKVIDMAQGQKQSRILAWRFTAGG